MLQDIKVMYITAKGGLSGVGKAWQDLESRIGSHKGRKFYGVYFPDRGEYRACVAITESDNPAALGLEVWEIPGGKYAQSKIDNWPAKLNKIGIVFNELAAEHDVDDARPSIEFYRSQSELILLLPIK